MFYRARTAHERLLVYPAVGTALGAWIGVFPIALDWDRPWQVRGYLHSTTKAVPTSDSRLTFVRRGH